jgi:capsid protein
MGVELDKQYKFPVAYWFWKRRPNDNYFNYNEYDQQLYTRVPAEEMRHVFVQTEDEEQVRGFPWIFAAVINLFRSGKFEEAALVNATIGARQGVFFKKKYPEGFTEQGGEHQRA